MNIKLMSIYLLFVFVLFSSCDCDSTNFVFKNDTKSVKVDSIVVSVFPHDITGFMASEVFPSNKVEGKINFQNYNPEGNTFVYEIYLSEPVSRKIAGSQGNIANSSRPCKIKFTLNDDLTVSIL